MLEEFLSYPFINNKFRRYYIDIITKVLSEERVYDSTIHENHHILPDAFGGTHVVPLTFREHYIAHALLTRFTKGKDRCKMTFALHTFFHFDYGRRPNLQRSILYEHHKRWFIEACKEREPWTKSDKFHLRHKDTGDEVYGTRRELVDYCDMTAQQLNHLLVLPDKPKRQHAKGWGIYIPSLGLFSYEIERPARGPLEKKECPHCHKNVDLANYNRWHGDRCKVTSINRVQGF